MQKTLYCAVSNKDQAEQNSNYKLLKQACKERSIAFVNIYAPAAAYDSTDVPELSKGGIYRVSPGDKRLTQYMYFLCQKNPQLKTWFNPKMRAPGGSMPWFGDMKAQLKNISILPTLFGVTNEINDELVDKIERRLGGFPVIIKKTGASHGAGIVIVDSLLSLRTIIGHITDKSRSERTVLRKFIRNARHFRIVVVGDKTVSAIEYKLPDNDVRTNVTDSPNVTPANPPQEVLDLALQAVENIGVFFGGVDILVDETGKAFVAEVNTPCNFSRNQNCTGDDVAGSIVEFLCETAV